MREIFRMPNRARILSMSPVFESKTDLAEVGWRINATVPGALHNKCVMRLDVGCHSLARAAEGLFVGSDAIKMEISRTVNTL
jgi:hypothetical protein